MSGDPRERFSHEPGRAALPRSRSSVDAAAPQRPPTGDGFKGRVHGSQAVEASCERTPLPHQGGEGTGERAVQGDKARSSDRESSLPGEDLVQQGLADLGAGRVTEPALLVLIAAPRLRRLGILVPDLARPRPYEHDLYALLEQRLGTAAHSYYNSLIRRIVSYARALEREQFDNPNRR
ncbi:MAG: hypothetical protein FJ398_24775 [Verrucomicrobia bacterium]|nr:hypothetical protein [Verrucomicrobiota bacterium]